MVQISSLSPHALEELCLLITAATVKETSSAKSPFEALKVKPAISSDSSVLRSAGRRHSQPRTFAVIRAPHSQELHSTPPSRTGLQREALTTSLIGANTKKTKVSTSSHHENSGKQHEGLKPVYYTYNRRQLKPTQKQAGVPRHNKLCWCSSTMYSNRARTLWLPGW